MLLHAVRMPLIYDASDRTKTIPHQKVVSEWIECVHENDNMNIWTMQDSCVYEQPNKIKVFIFCREIVTTPLLTGIHFIISAHSAGARLPHINDINEFDHSDAPGTRSLGYKTM